MITKRIIFGLLAFLLVFVGCWKKDGDAKKELVVMCGSSFRLPAEQLLKEFQDATGINSVISVAGSEDFLPLVKVGKEGEILITHDPFLEYVREAGALAASAKVGFVAPVIAVQKGNPKEIDSIDDLAGEGISVGLTNPEYSTCGEMVFGLLEKKGIKDAVLKNVGNRLTKGHADLGNFLKVGVVDAVIMWNGVANTFADSLDMVSVPYEYDSEIGVHVIGLNYSDNSMAVIEFVEFARERGPAIFAEHGYVK